MESLDIPSRTSADCTIFKITSKSGTLDYKNHFIRLPVIFLPSLRSSSEQNVFYPYLRVFMDSSRLEIGMYLTYMEAIFFIFKIEPDNRIILVRTNSVISLISKEETLLSNFHIYLKSDKDKLEAVLPFINKFDFHPGDILLTKTGNRHTIEKSILTESMWTISIY